MGKYKEKLLSDFYNSEIKIGEIGYVNDSFLRIDPQGKNIPVVVKNIENNILYVESEYYNGIVACTIDKKNFKRSERHIGANPIPNKDIYAKINFNQYNIESILYACGIEKRSLTIKMDKVHGVEIPEMNFNPFVYNENGDKIYYQRPLIWTLEEKQNLINSIYNNILCGTIVVRERPYSFIENLLKKNEDISSIGFNDVIDGKQRLNTLIEFVMDKFPDSNGYYFSDLSDDAQYAFFHMKVFSFGKLGEKTSDKETIETFIKLNSAGVKIDKEHINSIKSLIN